MPLSGPVAYATQSGRRLAEKLMTERCRVTRVDGLEVQPDGSEQPRISVVYEGKCKINSYESYETKPEASEHQFIGQRYQVHVPIDAPPLNVGDVVEVDGYRFDFRIVNDFQKTYATASRYFAEKFIA